MPDLKNCPACGAPATAGVSFANCSDNSCLLTGPLFDEGGAKWQALPRRADASQGMSDGELSARVAIGAMRWDNPWPFKQIDDESTAWHLANQAEVRAELDRRAAARKESKS